MMKWLWIIVILVPVFLLLLRRSGQEIHRKIPEGGICENMYVPINGTKQWISIYGKKKENPVLLYLHGGPGASTSSYDYAFTRKWADVYTVVTWDQRNCGKSWFAEANQTELTYDLWMADGLEMTKFLLDYLKKEKITLLGHSWGSIFGCNLVLACPEYYDCYIGTGQLVDFHENEIAFIEEASKWTANDEEGKNLLQKLTVGDFSADYRIARNALMKKYGYHIFADGRDYSLAAAQFFNPYYAWKDFWKLRQFDFSQYERFLNSEEFGKFSLLDRRSYSVPYYNINGDRDYQTNFRLAQAYFDSITAPRKEMYLMKDTTHGLLESKSDAFSEILHQIAETERMNRLKMEECS